MPRTSESEDSAATYAGGTGLRGRWAANRKRRAAKFCSSAIPKGCTARARSCTKSMPSQPICRMTDSRSVGCGPPPAISLPPSGASSTGCLVASRHESICTCATERSARCSSIEADSCRLSPPSHADAKPGEFHRERQRRRVRTARPGCRVIPRRFRGRSRVEQSQHAHGALTREARDERAASIVRLSHGVNRGSAPPRSSVRTAASEPRNAAQWRGRAPVGPPQGRLALAPALSSASSMVASPRAAATWTAVHPNASRESGCAPE
eukprot:scaffold113980_cov24-Tisochrysis_lutea.AAC.13